MAEPRSAELKRIEAFLEENSDADVVRHMVDETPWLFSDEREFTDWRRQIVADVEISHDAIFLVGSGAVGLALNRFKAGRLFRGPTHSLGPSDLDIAVVDETSFHAAWDETVLADRERRLGRGFDTRVRIRMGVYWGHLSQRHLPLGSAGARLALVLTSAAGRFPRLRGHPSSVRFYRRMDDLRGYQYESIQSLRRDYRGGLLT